MCVVPPRTPPPQRLTRPLATDYADMTFSATSDGEPRQPVYNEGIGLAVEPLRSGGTLDSLWAVVAAPEAVNAEV